jgi:GT2 family glycosyltransferase
MARDAGLLSTMQVFVTDNSCDAIYRESVSVLLQKWAGDETWRFHYIAQPDNRGFGAGHNATIDSLQSDVHLILNPDVVLEPDSLRAGLARMSQSNDIALLSPRVMGPQGKQEFLCKRYPSVWVLFLRAFAPGFLKKRFTRVLEQYEMRDLCSGKEEVEVELASGCYMLIPTGLLKIIGGFDPRYFLYFEDFDVSLRLAGHGRLVYLPAMQIEHHGGYAARKGVLHVLYFVRSGWRFFSSHGWRWI